MRLLKILHNATQLLSCDHILYYQEESVAELGRVNNDNVDPMETVGEGDSNDANKIKQRDDHLEQ